MSVPRDKEQYQPHNSIKPLVKEFLQQLMKHYWGPLYQYLKSNPHLVETVTGFIVSHSDVIVYVGRTHIAIEYYGPERIDEIPSDGKMNVTTYDYSTRDVHLLEKIVGFSYDSTVGFSLGLPKVSENLLLPTNRGMDKLLELKWNFAAQSSVMAFNSPLPEVLPGQFARIINGIFFDADESGLKTRHIKWLDFLPIQFDGSDSEVDSIAFNLSPMTSIVEADAHYCYPLPDEYKFEKLPKINRFIELWGNRGHNEQKITSFLAQKENEFILTMKFGATRLLAEATCEWQSQDKKEIRPDFFVVQPNGYADIVEFKLPYIEKSFIVGSENREAFSSWLASYVAQTRVYASYFDDPNNRAWFKDKYGFSVYKPRRWLVVGRRDDFEPEIWREICADYKDLDILTFDDLVDGVVVQFYK